MATSHATLVTHAPNAAEGKSTLSVAAVARVCMLAQDDTNALDACFIVLAILSFLSSFASLLSRVDSSAG